MPDGLVPQHRIRIKVFVDFWNFQLSMNSLESGFLIDWRKLGEVVAQEALLVADADSVLRYEGMNVYGSYDPLSEKDKNLFRWATNTLNKFTGVRSVMIERRRKRSHPKCPSCHVDVSDCPNCGADMRGTEEKAVDTRIATDMISLAWDNGYDVAALLSSDGDFVPIVRFLASRGFKTVHGAFPPAGSELAQACWGSISIPNIRERFRR